MKYEETYYGHRLVVTTATNAAGRWTSKAELIDVEVGGAPLDAGLDTDYLSEEDARRAALSAAASVIDRARQSKGKA